MVLLLVLKQKIYLFVITIFISDVVFVIFIAMEICSFPSMGGRLLFKNKSHRRVGSTRAAFTEIADCHWRALTFAEIQ